MKRVQSLVLTGVSFIITLYQLVDKALTIYRNNQLLQRLLKTRVYRPSELANLSSQLNQGSWVAIEGLLKSSNPLIGEDQSKLIYLITLLKEKSWLSSLSEIIVSQKQYATDIYIQDPLSLDSFAVQGIKNSDLSRSL